MIYLRRAVYNSSGRRYIGEENSNGRTRQKRKETERDRERERERGRARGIRFGLAPAIPTPTSNDVGGSSLGAAIATVRPCHKG